MEQLNIKAEFDALCQAYGLTPIGQNEEELYIPNGHSFDYPYLLNLFYNRRIGKALSTYEILSDFKAFDIAKVLNVLSFSKGGFTLTVNPYSIRCDNPTIVEVLKKSLEEALGQIVEKYPCFEIDGKDQGATMVLSKGFGGGGNFGRGIIIPYPKGCIPKKDGFSPEELDAIIAHEKVQKERARRMRGNKERWEEEGYSRLPDLGEQAQWLMNYIPLDWDSQTKRSFVADYMFQAGFLDFKSDSWKASFNSKTNKEKSKLVENWIKAYNKAILPLF